MNESSIIEWFFYGFGFFVQIILFSLQIKMWKKFRERHFSMLCWGSVFMMIGGILGFAPQFLQGYPEMAFYIFTSAGLLTVLGGVLALAGAWRLFDRYIELSNGSGT